MIPSDHFVRFYNEVFKFLDSCGGLSAYYGEISRHQDFHCLDNFKQNGLQGVYDYYVKIRKEENCDMELIFHDRHMLELKMNTCPSLSKAINNDAGACKKYCLHCPGWTQGLYTRAGLYQIYDLMGLDNPQCTEYIFDDLEQARKYYREISRNRNPEELLINFEP